MLSLVHMFLSLRHVFPSASLREGGKKGRWVGTSDVMLTNTSNGKLDSFCPPELPCFLLSFFFSVVSFFLNLSWSLECKFSFEFQPYVGVGCKVNMIALCKLLSHAQGREGHQPSWEGSALQFSDLVN